MSRLPFCKEGRLCLLSKDLHERLCKDSYAIAEEQIAQRCSLCRFVGQALTGSGLVCTPAKNCQHVPHK